MLPEEQFGQMCSRGGRLRYCNTGLIWVEQHANDYSPITIAKRIHEDARDIMTDAAWRLVADFTAFVFLLCWPIHRCPAPRAFWFFAMSV
jgi:hypothetical protein